MADVCPGILWSILWFFALLFVGWPVGFLVAWFYVLISPCSACIEPMKSFCEALLKVVQLPIFFAESMVQMKGCGG